MNPDLEDFLQSTFESLRSTDNRIGRVIVKPDYEAELHPDDRKALQNELLQSLQGKSLDSDYEPAAEQQPTLSRYVLRIALQTDRVPDSPWIQVEPAGEWI